MAAGGLIAVLREDGVGHAEIELRARPFSWRLRAVDAAKRALVAGDRVAHPGELFSPSMRSSRPRSAMASAMRAGAFGAGLGDGHGGEIALFRLREMMIRIAEPAFIDGCARRENEPRDFRIVGAREDVEAFQQIADGARLRLHLGDDRVTQRRFIVAARAREIDARAFGGREQGGFGNARARRSRRASARISFHCACVTPAERIACGSGCADWFSCANAGVAARSSASIPTTEARAIAPLPASHDCLAYWPRAARICRLTAGAIFQRHQKPGLLGLRVG